MPMLTTPARSQATPLNAPSVIGVAKLQRRRNQQDDEPQRILVANLHSLLLGSWAVGHI